MKRVTTPWLFGVVVVLVAAAAASAQNQYIGYVYPAGGQQGTTFQVRFGGQRLTYACGIAVSGEGVSARLVAHYPALNNQELSLLRQQLKELKKKETKVSAAMIKEMAAFEFPKPIGPQTAPPPKKAARKDAPQSAQEIAKQKLIERIERRLAADERFAADRSHAELVFAEVTIAPDAKPGRREIRVITKLGVSNPLPFFVGQVPEVARKPMKTSKRQILGKEYLAQRKRPPEEEVQRVTLPCTMNGQIASGEINRYRFHARKGQRLVVSVKARQLVPYIANGVPGWFQPVIKLSDANGKELAYDDDYRFSPDPVLYFEVPKDGEYVLSITDALYRGRENFVYRITIGQLPFLTGIFPLGGRVGKPVKIRMSGWNLDGATLVPPGRDAAPGIHQIAASKGKQVSNYVPFALDTLPECLEKEPNNVPSAAQKVTLPIIVNGRIDRPDDWDVFAVHGNAGETIVVEVLARRLGSPLDSFVKVTTPDRKVIALNDDHHDAGSGLNTHHADSYLMVKLPADGKYFVCIGDTAQHGGKEYAYRLRISHPRPDFALRLVPSRICIRKKAAASVAVYAIRKDGFDGPIQLSFQQLPDGFKSNGATVRAKKATARIALKTTRLAMAKPTPLTVIGTAKIGKRTVVHQAVPAEDRMQAFLWRHLVPAQDLPVLVYDPGYKPPATRVRRPIRDEDRPKNVKPRYTAKQVKWRLRQIENLYQRYFLTDDFTNRLVARIEAETIPEKDASK